MCLEREKCIFFSLQAVPNGCASFDLRPIWIRSNPAVSGPGALAPVSSFAPVQSFGILQTNSIGKTRNCTGTPTNSAFD